MKSICFLFNKSTKIINKSITERMKYQKITKKTLENMKLSIIQ